MLIVGVHYNHANMTNDLHIVLQASESYDICHSRTFVPFVANSQGAGLSVSYRSIHKLMLSLQETLVIIQDFNGYLVWYNEGVAHNPVLTSLHSVLKFSFPCYYMYYPFIVFTMYKIIIVLYNNFFDPKE